MKTTLITLSFCFALFFSANGRAYNEAMCILIKQEMQQHSHDQTSGKYRKAARDYRKNCNKAKQILSQTKPVINQPIPNVSETQPKSNQEKQTPDIEQQNNTKTQNEQAPELTNEQKPLSNNAQATKPEKIEVNLDPSKIDAEQAAVTPITNNNQSTPIETKQAPINPVVKVPIDKPIPVAPAQSTTEPTSSLLLPSFILLLVLLIGALVMMHVRRLKKANSAASEDNTEKENINTTQMQSPLNKIADAKSDAQLNKHTPTDVEKPAINTVEFEAAAKATLARIKDANTFKEPEVRSFDPNAKPIKKQRQHTTQITNPHRSSRDSEQPAVEPSEHTAAPIKKNEPEHNDIKNDETLSAHDFKEPEVRTYDPHAPLPTHASTASKIAKQNTAQINEPHPEIKKVDSNNPFANLSLDESWDPNSTTKPIIEPKKQGPKSKALIEAQERAKKLKTKE